MNPQASDGSAGSSATSQDVARLPPNVATRCRSRSRGNPPIGTVSLPATTFGYSLGSRRDTPALSVTARGSRCLAEYAMQTQERKVAAMDKFVNDQYATSSAASRDSLLSTWLRFHDCWFNDSSCCVAERVDAFPLSPCKIFAVGTLLKAGGYRSSANYFSRARDFHIASGFQWTDLLSRAVRVSIASVNRGIGPARQSLGLPLRSVVALKLSSSPLVEGDPINPGLLVVIGSFFCTREIKLSLALREHVTVQSKLSGDLVSWLLPCSKTDPSALGKRRSWGCVCTSSVGAPCAFHALVDHLDILRREFGSESQWPGLPLFPDMQGRIVAKEKVVATIECIAVKLGLDIFGPTGARLFGGHSLRVTGAQWLASIGIPLMTIQLVARWSSSVILRYVGETPLETVTSTYRRAQASSDLETALEQCCSNAERIKGIVDGLSAESAAHFEEELNLKKSLSNVQEQLSRFTSPPYICSKLQKVHVAACKHYMQTPAFMWRAKCGWTFGLSPHTLFSELPADRSKCSSCFCDEVAEGFSDAEA